MYMTLDYFVSLRIWLILSKLIRVELMQYWLSAVEFLTQIDISPKKTYRWLRNTWKDAQHCSLLEKCKSKPQWGTISCQSEWPLSKSLQTINPGAASVATSLQSCPTLCNSIDGNPPGSSVPGILQARTLEWVAISFSSTWQLKLSRSVVSDS